MLRKEVIPYQSDNTTLEGYLVYDDSFDAPQPAVIVAHAWQGQGAFEREQADRLAELGYVGFAADVYGREIYAETDEEALELMTPLFQDRSHLRQRIYAAYYIVEGHERVDRSRIGSIGFCFGGLTAIELLRSGADLKGTVSFHGGFGDTLGDLKAKCPPDQKPMNGSVLILHGEEDPIVSDADIKDIKKELTEAKVDWQIHTYGQTMHSFTNPKANDLEKGLQYNPKAARRSWQAMSDFFEEVFE